MTKLSDQQLTALRSLANKKIGFSCQGNLGKFMDSWLVTEVVAKRLITYKTKKDVGKTWSWTEVEASVKYFELPIPVHLSTQKIFTGGPGRNIDRTPRQLRNVFLHGISDEILQEINDKSEEFSNFLDEWLHIVTQK